MDQRNRIRALVVSGLVIVSILMLIPTIANLNLKRGEEGPLPEWYTKIFDKKMILGLDLQGGIHLQYKVAVRKALRRKAKQTAGNVESLLLKEKKTKVIAELQKLDGPINDDTSYDDITTIKITFPAADKTGLMDPDYMTQNLPDYAISDITDAIVTIVMTDPSIETFRESALDQAIETIERRINAFGVAESSISKRGDSELVIQLPGIKESDFAAAKKQLAQTGQLHFQIVDRTEKQGEFYKALGANKPDGDKWPKSCDESLKKHRVVVTSTSARSTSRKLLQCMADGLVDKDHVIGFEKIFVDPNDKELNAKDQLSAEQEKQLSKQRTDDVDLEKVSTVKGYRLWYMYGKIGMSGENVEDASVGYDEFNRPEVYMRFAQVDADKFFEMTKENTKELMAIMIDEMVYSAPRIKEPIGGGRVRIELGSAGRQALKEANALVAVLKSGALQAPLEKRADNAVGPTLGADSVEAGKLSIIVGLVLVIFFMMVYYKKAGAVADLALILNLLFVMAGLTMFGATLTLPGIAGIVLTVGMAVDANVLIFERIREEIRDGKGVRQSINAGYEKAFTAILDANVTTGLAAIVLYQFGSGPIRGFAVTLGIGIVCSMYTALVVTRLVFERMYGRGPEPARMSI